MVSFAVDSQTTMVESNEKPSVTPAMLAAWVFLLGTADPDSVAIADRVRLAACHPRRRSLCMEHSRMLLWVVLQCLPSHSHICSSLLARLQCRSVLSARGFELDIKPTSSKRKEKGKGKGRPGKRAGGSKEVSAIALQASGLPSRYGS